MKINKISKRFQYKKLCGVREELKTVHLLITYIEKYSRFDHRVNEIKCSINEYTHSLTLSLTNIG